MTVVPSVAAGTSRTPADRSTWRCLDPEPIAARGGVVLLPMAAPTPIPDTWPETIPVRCLSESDSPDHTVAEGVLGWLVPTPPRVGSRWTDSAEPFTVIGTPPETGGGVPLLLVETPPGFAGALELNGERIEPRWLDPPSAPRRPVERIPSGSPDARPDAEHPLEWYRWVILADRLGIEPPSPPGDRAGRLAARHFAEIWRSAIARIESQSVGVAAELRERLTEIGSEVEEGIPPRDVAMWIADPRALRALLSIMLDASIDDRAAMQGALAWLRAEPPVTMWLESSLGDRAVIGLANPGVDLAVVRCRWLDGDPVPVAIAVPPRTAMRFVIDRPVALAAAADGGVLVVEHAGLERRLDFGPAPIPVRPPGLPLGELRLPLTLAGAQIGEAPLPPPERRAIAELRRRAGRWELFIECFRPPGSKEDRLALRIGPAGSETGRLDIQEGRATAAEPAKVSQASYADRWRCRIELPDVWLAEGFVGDRAPATGIGLARRLQLADGRFEISLLGPSRPAWRTEPPTIVVDLSAWPASPEPGASSTTESPTPPLILAP
ncbi:MAG: hypothetical protein ACO3EP_08680 [Phycisphaerales bacterium]